MKTIKLTKGYETIVSDSDYEYLNQWTWYANVKRKGRTYAYRNRDKMPMARLLANAPKGLVVDHINGDSLDNRIENLRVVTNQQNLWNSERRGYYWDKSRSKWSVIFTMPDGSRKHIGRFDNEFEASNAYKEAVKTYRGY